MKASRAAIKTAKAVVTVEERLGAVEMRQAATLRQLIKIEKLLQQLVTAVSADKPSAQGQGAPPKVRTVRKRGGS